VIIGERARGLGAPPDSGKTIIFRAKAKFFGQQPAAKNENMKNKKALLSQRRPRDAPNIIMGALKSFESPRKRPRLLFPKFVKGFCSDRY